MRAFHKATPLQRSLALSRCPGAFICDNFICVRLYMCIPANRDSGRAQNEETTWFFECWVVRIVAIGFLSVGLGVWAV